MDRVQCHLCQRPNVGVTNYGKYMKHKPNPDKAWEGEWCQASQTIVPSPVAQPLPAKSALPAPATPQETSRTSTAPTSSAQTTAAPSTYTRATRPDVQEMSPRGQQIATMFKEIFYQYTNQTGRSSQTHLGPSEIGTPCNRRLAMSLMQRPHVNPGGDGWAAFMGTCMHAGLAEMFMWADAGRGRFATEVGLDYPNIHVPHGTSDLLDRVLFMVDDHKGMGHRALETLRRKGPKPTQRVQLHVYALGQRLRGERIDYVALVAWPRDQSSLDTLYVWEEPYDPAIAKEAFDRVDRLAAAVEQEVDPYTLPIADDCEYCPFHHAGHAQVGGCNGRV